MNTSRGTMRPGVGLSIGVGRLLVERTAARSGRRRRVRDDPPLPRGRAACREMTVPRALTLRRTRDSCRFRSGRPGVLRRTGRREREAQGSCQDTGRRQRTARSLPNIGRHDLVVGHARCCRDRHRRRVALQGTRGQLVAGAREALDSNQRRWLREHDEDHQRACPGKGLARRTRAQEAACGEGRPRQRGDHPTCAPETERRPSGR